MSDSISVVDELLTDEDVSRLLKVPLGTVKNWRYIGEGPAFVKTNPKRAGRVRYRASDVQAWIEGLTRIEPMNAQDVDAARAKHAE